MKVFASTPMSEAGRFTSLAFVLAVVFACGCGRVRSLSAEAGAPEAGAPDTGRDVLETSVAFGGGEGPGSGSPDAPADFPAFEVYQDLDRPGDLFQDDAPDGPGPDIPGDVAADVRPDVLCSAGLADCDDRAENGCETNSLRDPANCGTCGKRCLAGEECSLGECRWTPRAVPGLVLWFDAGVGTVLDSNGRVVHWQDQSEKGNHAFQNSEGNRPVLALRAVNGRPMVTFGVAGQSGVYLRVLDSGSLQWGTGDFAVFVVGTTMNTLVDHGTFFRKQALYDPFTGLVLISGPNGAGTLTAQLRFEDVRVVAPGTNFNNGRPFLFAARRFGGSVLEVRVNGTSSVQSTVPILDISNPGRDIFIGAHGEDLRVQQLYGAIAEMLAFRGSLSAQQLNTIEAFLREKYALP